MGAIDHPVLRDCKVLFRGKNYAGVGDWLDESGNNNHGVITDATFDNTRGAFHFNSSTDKIVVSHNATLDFADGEDLTVMIVVESTSLSGYQTPIAKRDQGWTGAPGYGIVMNPTGPYFTCGVCDGTSSIAIADLGSGSLSTGNVYIVAGTIDMSGGTDLVRGYWEGSQVYNGVDLSSLGSPTNTKDLVIGQYSGGYDPFLGYVYAVAIWDRILSHWEIAAATVALRPFNRVLPLSFSRVQTGLELAGKTAIPFGGE